MCQIKDVSDIVSDDNTNTDLRYHGALGYSSEREKDIIYIQYLLLRILSETYRVYNAPARSISDKD